MIFPSLRGGKMHFFYLDETGCNGTDLDATQEPIFVLGGISVKDQGWVRTTEYLETIIERYFKPNIVPPEFELHAHELISPNGDGPFAQHDRTRRNKLALDLLDLLAHRGHQVHFIAIDKQKLDSAAVGTESGLYNARVPYLLCFDYITTYVNEFVKKKLGHTARGIIILDEKEQFDDPIANITRFRRFKAPRSQRIKWLVEFSYLIDSKKHPLIQMTELVVYCTKKFLELESGYRDTWPDSAKNFYATCFEKIYSRVRTTSLVKQDGRHARAVNELLIRVVPKLRRNWKQHYGLISRNGAPERI